LVLIQSSNEFKIYLKVILGIYLEKKEKGKSFSLPPLSHFGLLAQLPDGPLTSLPSPPPILLPGLAQLAQATVAVPSSFSHQR